MKKILLLSLLLGVTGLPAQTVIRKDGGTTTAPQTRGFVDQSFLGSGDLILGVAFNLYAMEEFDPVGTYDYESALIVAPEVSAEYGLGLINVQDWEDAYLIKFGGQLNFGGY